MAAVHGDEEPEPDCFPTVGSLSRGILVLRIAFLSPVAAMIVDIDRETSKGTVKAI